MFNLKPVLVPADDITNKQIKGYGMINNSNAITTDEGVAEAGCYFPGQFVIRYVILGKTGWITITSSEAFTVEPASMVTQPAAGTTPQAAPAAPTPRPAPAQPATAEEVEEDDDAPPPLPRDDLDPTATALYNYVAKRPVRFTVPPHHPMHLSYSSVVFELVCFLHLNHPYISPYMTG